MTPDPPPEPRDVPAASARDGAAGAPGGRPDVPDDGPPERGRGRVAAGLLLAALVGLALWRGGEAVEEAVAWVDGLGPWGAAAFVAIYAAATVASVPGSWLTLAAGALFGLLRGTLYTLLGATAGATLAFLVGRHLARSAVERRVARSPRLRAVDEAVEAEGPKVVLLLRLSPAVPFNLLNYALGLTGVRLTDYLWASAVGMLPGTFLYVYAGHAAGRVATVGGAPRGAASWVLLAVGLAATVAATALVARAARRALDDARGPVRPG